MKNSIELAKYREVDRVAEVGEKIKVIDAKVTYGDYDNGDIFTVESRYGRKGIWAKELPEGAIYIGHSEYVVLEPLDNESSSTDLSDLVIRLSQTVARQQSEIDTLKADLQSFAETATEADYKAGQALTTSADLSDKVDMITDDVVMLDERSQPLVDDSKDDLATELADTVIRKIREAIE